MAAHEQTHPINGSKPTQIRGGDGTSVNLLYRYRKQMLRIFIAFVAVLFSFSVSYSQDIVPKFDWCRAGETEYISICDPWEQFTEVMEYYPGCFIEATYIIRKCTTLGNVNWQMELAGYRVTNFPGCAALYSQLIEPTGAINEIKSREIVTNIYKYVADRKMKEYKNTLSQAEIDDDFACVPCSTGNNSYCSKRGIKFFKAYDGTCMARCRASQYVTYVNDPYGPNPSGMFPPNLIIPLTPAIHAIPAGTYSSQYITYVKCNETCCLIDIDYCFDLSNNTWKRKYNSESTDDEVLCTPVSMPSNICPLPIILVGTVVNTVFDPIIQCMQTCVTVDNSIQTLSW
jgi:hypothetical protein